MNLTEVISSRKLDFEPVIEVEEEIIRIGDIGTEIRLQHDWHLAPSYFFEESKSSYLFPEIEGLSRKDKKTYQESVFPPLLLLVSNKSYEHAFNPVILTYLYHRESLTGPALLNIRSINKFEMMWAPYFIDAYGPIRTSPKVLKVCGYQASLSKPLSFIFRSKLYSQPIESRLRTLTVDLLDFVLTFYIIDNHNCQISEEEADEFIQNISIKASPNHIQTLATPQFRSARWLSF